MFGPGTAVGSGQLPCYLQCRAPTLLQGSGHRQAVRRVDLGFPPFSGGTFQWSMTAGSVRLVLCWPQLAWPTRTQAGGQEGLLAAVSLPRSPCRFAQGRAFQTSLKLHWLKLHWSVGLDGRHWGDKHPALMQPLHNNQLPSNFPITLQPFIGSKLVDVLQDLGS